LPDFTENNGKKPSGSLLIRILIFLGLVGLTVVAMQPVQKALHDEINHIRTEFIGKIEAATGLEIRYSSIRPSFMSSFDIRNLKFMKGETAVLSVSRVKIFYSLLELIKRQNTAISGIRIDRPQIRVDMERDRELFLSLSGGSNTESSFSKFIADIFPEQPDVKIRDGLFAFTDEKIGCLLQDIDIDIGGSASELTIDANMDAEVSFANPFIDSFSAKTKAAIKGAWKLGLPEADAQINLTKITGSGQGELENNGLFSILPASDGGVTRTLFETVPLSCSLVFREGKLNIDTTSVAPFNSSFEYNTKTGGIAAALNCENIPITEIVKLSNVSKDVNYFLSTAITGGVSFASESGVMRYGADFRSERQRTGDYFALRANGNDKNIVVDELRFFAGSRAEQLGYFYGNVSLFGKAGFSPFTPEGTVSLENFSLSGESGVNALLSVSTNGGEIQVSGENVALGEFVLSSADIFLLPSERDLNVLLYGVYEDEATINMEAILNYEPMQLEASVALASFSVSCLPQMILPFAGSVNIPAPVKMFLDNTTIDTEAFITTDFKNIVYNVPNIDVITDDITASLSFSGSDSQLTLSDGIFTWMEKDILVSASVDFSDPTDLFFLINAGYLDMSWQFEGQLMDKTVLIVHDPYGFNAYGSTSDSGGISGYLEATDFTVPVYDKPVSTSFYITLRYSSLDFWNIDISRFEARGLDTPNGTGYLQLSCTADQDGAGFRNLLYRDNTGELAGSADFVWKNNFSDIQFFANITDGSRNGESYFVEGDFIDSHLAVNASVSGMHVERFIKDAIPLTINADASFSWDSINSFNANLDLKSLHVKLQNSDVQASATATLTNDEVAISGLQLNLAALEVSIPVLQISRIDGFAKASMDIHGQLLKKQFASEIEVNTNFNNIDSWADIRHALDNIDGSLKAENIQYGDIIGETAVFAFSREDGELSVSGGPRNMLRLEMDSNGDFFASLSSPFPIQSTAAGRFKDGYLDAHLADFYIDLSDLWTFMPQMDGFNINGGYLTAKIDARGPIDNPEFFGTGRGASFRMQVPDYIEQDIKPVPFDFVMEGNELVFSNVAVTSGGGRGTVDGWLRFENWVPKELGLDIAVPRESPVPYHFNKTSFMANGDASGRISIVLENFVMEINGDLYANNTIMGINNNEPTVGADNDSDDEGRVTSVANITITTGPVVEFVWPNTNMPILRANPVMGTVLTFSVDMESGQYSLNSDIMIRSGELYYFDRNFYIRQGNLTFRENEQQFNPQLSARAEIRDRTDSGAVTISMIIENQPLLSFEPRFEATPVLTQLEIYSLLGQNMYSIAGTGNIDTAQRFIVSSTTDLMVQFVANTEFFAQFDALRRFERFVRNFLKLDMFSVRTRILQNAFSNAAMPVFSTVDRTNRVGNYFDNTTVFIGKYVGQDMFVQGMLSMRYNENNPDFGGLSFEPDIGIELQSPFFSIRWNFFPYHPENWWVNDNAITVTVRKTF